MSISNLLVPNNYNLKAQSLTVTTLNASNINSYYCYTTTFANTATTTSSVNVYTPVLFNSSIGSLTTTGFSINNSTGAITYNGTNGVIYQVSFSGTVYTTNYSSGTIIQIALGLGNGPSINQASVISIAPTGNNIPISFSTFVPVILSTGNVFKICSTQTGTGNSTVITNLNVIFTQI